MSEGSIALVKFSLSYKPNHPTIHLESSENISVPLRLPPPLHLFYHIGYLIVSVNLKFFIVMNICNIQNQGQRIIVVPFRFFFHIGVPPLFEFLNISFSAYLPFYLFRFLHAALLDIHKSLISQCARPPFWERLWRFISVQTVILLSKYTIERNYHLPSSYRYKLDKTIALQYHKCNRYNQII